MLRSPCPSHCSNEIGPRSAGSVKYGLVTRGADREAINEDRRQGLRKLQLTCSDDPVNDAVHDRWRTLIDFDRTKPESRPGELLNHQELVVGATERSDADPGEAGIEDIRAIRRSVHQLLVSRLWSRRQRNVFAG